MNYIFEDYFLENQNILFVVSIVIFVLIVIIAFALTKNIIKKNK